MSFVIKDLCFTYPQSNKPVIRNLSAAFYPGEIAAITGNNGCGKTTLIKLMLGIMKPETGIITLFGKSIKNMSLAHLGSQVGYLMQNPDCQLFCPTVEEEISYGLRNQKLSETQISVLVARYLEYFQLQGHRKSFPLHLSQGEKQRLMLAAIFAMQPRYLLLDEPTSGLDMYNRKLLGDYLLKMSGEGCGVIFVSHEQSFLYKYAGRELRMENGQIEDEKRWGK